MDKLSDTELLNFLIEEKASVAYYMDNLWHISTERSECKNRNLRKCILEAIVDTDIDKENPYQVE